MGKLSFPLGMLFLDKLSFLGKTFFDKENLGLGKLDYPLVIVLLLGKHSFF